MSRKTKKQSRGSGVLRDHKQEGKQFLPPLVAALGDKLAPVSWVDQLLPEVIWLELLRIYEPNRFPELAVEVARACHSAAAQTRRAHFARISDYSLLDEAEAGRARELIRTKGILPEIQRSLVPLTTAYPECPLRRLIDVPGAPGKRSLPGNRDDSMP